MCQPPRTIPAAQFSSSTNLTMSEQNCTYSSYFRLKDEPWVIPLMVLSTLNIAAIASFEIFVLYKSCNSRRHLFLGQMLLFGLFLCSALGFAFIPTDHWVLCAITRVGIGLAYVLVFATLLVKCVFLLSLHVGIYLPTALQGLLLFFMIGVQVVIAVQWLVFEPPVVFPDSGVCNTNSTDLILSLVYDMFLLVAVCALAVRTRKLHENHREALFIGTTVGLTIPLWVAWILVALLTDNRNYDACVAFGVVLTSSVVFLVMFLPKGRQLAAMGREDMYPDDRDGMSSLNQSTYTPSFLHLKPPMLPLVKQGTLIKPLTPAYSPPDRGFYFPQIHPPSRVWRYSHPANMQMTSAEDIYYNTDRFFFSPNMKLYRNPIY